MLFKGRVVKLAVSVKLAIMAVTAVTVHQDMLRMEVVVVVVLLVLLLIQVKSNALVERRKYMLTESANVSVYSFVINLKIERSRMLFF